MSENWRGVVAALLNPDLRAALGELSDHVRLTEARRTRALQRLAGLGLVELDATGRASFTDAALRAMLAEGVPVRPMGAERFLDGEGRIDRYPVRAAERRALLKWVAERVLRPGETLSEREINERLAAFTDDVAALRRYLVDHELIERTRSGSQYARVTPARA
jgi:hypothetical protein